MAKMYSVRWALGVAALAAMAGTAQARVCPNGLGRPGHRDPAGLPACRRSLQSIPPTARRVAGPPGRRRDLRTVRSHTTGPPMNAPIPSPTPLRQRWQAFMKAAEHGFHAYGSWLVTITWKRFSLLAVLLIIGANILQTLPPFSFSWQLPVETTETIHSKPAAPKDLRKERKAQKSEDSDDTDDDARSARIEKAKEAAKQAAAGRIAALGTLPAHTPEGGTA